MEQLARVDVPGHSDSWANAPQSLRGPTHLVDVCLVANDRPMYWACQREHYWGCFRPRKLPSVSQFCRRVGAERFQRMLQALHDMLTSDSSLAQLNFIDGKPLAVGNYTRDPDARNGWGAGRVEP